MNDAPQDSFHLHLQRSLAQPGQSRFADLAGIRMHYLEWEAPPGAPTLVLLHGFLAHAHWWDFVAPWLAADGYRVIAPDFGGMGDSSCRERYRDEDFVEEIGALLQHLGGAPCAVVGHSFGGRALLYACKAFPALIQRALIVDSRLSSPEDPMRGFEENWRPKKRYGSEAEILPRFVLRPEEPAPAAALAHMARHSVRQDPDGWVWKFDEQITRLFRNVHTPRGDEHAAVAGLAVPVDLVRGEFSRVVTAQRAARLQAALGAGVREALVIPGGWHHLSVSEPVALVTALRALLAEPR
ncbi:MAG: hypothetical protein RL026_974 [Pseudomonadota bacterium]|jgi:pimeloyl-ACP methyl ester carboxylesterase